MSKPNSHRTFGGVYCHGNKIWPQKNKHSRGVQLFWTNFSGNRKNTNFDYVYHTLID